MSLSGNEQRNARRISCRCGSWGIFTLEAPRPFVQFLFQSGVDCANRWKGIGTRIGAMNRDADNVGPASRLPVQVASLPPECSTGKHARRTGSQDGCPTTILRTEGGFRPELTGSVTPP